MGSHSFYFVLIIVVALFLRHSDKIRRSSASTEEDKAQDEKSSDDIGPFLKDSNPLYEVESEDRAHELEPNEISCGL